MRVCGEPQNDVAVTLAPAAHPHESRGYKINGLRVRGVLHGVNALLDWLKCRSEHGCGQLGNALSPTAVSTPSLISLCCNSMNTAGLFTATIACIAAVKFLQFFVVNS
jgi:hypothetical protein